MTQFVLCCFYVVLFVVIIYKSKIFRLPGLSSHHTVLLFLLKVFTGTALWSVFVSYYPVSDADVFFRDSKILYDSFYEHPSHFFKLFFGLGDVNPEVITSKMQIWNSSYSTFFIHDSRTMIRLNTLFRFFSLGHFYVHTVLMCFLSFTGLACLYRLFLPFLQNLKIVLVIACFLLPSVLFWSSAVLKEGPLFLGLGLLLYHTQCGLRNNYSFKNSIGALTGIFILVLVKIYVLIALCPALLANFWIAFSNRKQIVARHLVSCLFFVLLIFLTRFAAPAFDVVKIVKNKQTDFINVAKGGMVIYHDSTYIYLDHETGEDQLQIAEKGQYKLKEGLRYASFKPGTTDTVMIDGTGDNRGFRVLYSLVPATSIFDIPRLEPSLPGILANAPLAFLNTLIMPSLFNSEKAFSRLILMENMFLLTGMVIVFFFFRKKEVPLSMVFFCFSFVIILFTLIGITTPVLGALVRYRIPGIPFLIIGFALFTDEVRLIRFFNRLKGTLLGRRSYPETGSGKK